MKGTDINYRQIVEESDNGILIGELATHRILYMSEACLRIMGLEEDYCGKTCYQMLYESESLCSDCDIASLDMNVMVSAHVRHPQTQKDIMIHRKRIEWDGKPAWIEFIVDETELMSSERTTRHLLENLPCGIGIFELIDGKVVQKYLNDSYFSMLGTTREERSQFFGDRTLEPIFEEDLPLLKKAIENAIHGDGIIDIVLRLLDGKQQYEWYRLRAVRVENNPDRVVFHCAYFYVDPEKKAQDREMEAQEIMRAAIAYSGLLYWEYDYETHSIEMIGDSDLNGYIPRHLDNIPDSWFAIGIMHPKYIETAREVFTKLHQGQPQASCDVQTFSPNGKELHWQHVVMTALLSSDGIYRKAIGIAYDITEQKQAAERYEELLAYQKSKKENSAVFIHIDIASNQVLECINRMPIKISANETDTAEHFLRKVLKKYPELDNKLPGAGYGSCCLRLLRAFDEGKTAIDIDIQKPDEKGYHHWYAIRLELIRNPNSRDVECYIIATDIQDRKRQQLIFQKIRDAEVDYLSYVDLRTRQNNRLKVKENGTETKIYESYLEMCDELLKGTTQAEYVRVKKKLQIERLKEVLQTTETVIIVYCSYSSQEDKRWKQLRSFYLDETKEVLGFVRTDITAIYEKQEKEERILQNALLEAKRANNAKSDFLSQMSHDMRTPMNAIIGLIKLTLSEEMSETVRDNLRKINSSSQILLGLINDILDMAKIESGKIELHPEFYEYEEFLDTIRATFDLMCQTKNITLTIARSEVVYPISVDKVRFNQIFFNLLSNAVKYTGEGGNIYFDCRGEREADGRIRCRFWLKDTGIGMSKQFVEHAFEPFVRDSSIANEIQGTGIGLAITKNLVELMGGTIEIQSELGKGTIVYIGITVDEAQEVDGMDHSIGEEEQIRILKNRRVLVVEDNLMNQEIATRLLAKKGVDTETADDGQKGVDSFRQSKPGYYDAILMDIRMPVMNGLEATKEIRALKREDALTVPIIAMTADAYEEDREQSLCVGMDEHLTKPVNTKELYEVLAMLIKRRG